MSLDRRIVLVIFGAVLAAIAYGIGFPMTAVGVLAGLPIGLLNYQLMFSVRQQWAEAPSGQSGQFASALGQRTMLRLVLSGGALFLASTVSPEFLVGALVGIVIEMLSYFGDAFKVLISRKG